MNRKLWQGLMPVFGGILGACIGNVDDANPNTSAPGRSGPTTMQPLPGPGATAGQPAAALPGATPVAVPLPAAGTGTGVGPAMPTPQGGGQPKGDQPPGLGGEGDPNAVAGSTLFSCSAGKASSSEPRIWRINAAQYSSVVKELYRMTGVPKDPKLPNPLLGSVSDERYENYASSFGMDTAGLLEMIDGADAQAKILIKAMKLKARCLGDATLQDACVQAQFAPLARLLFRRPPSEAELGKYVTAAVGGQAQLGAQVSLELTLQAMLLSPQFLFRSEIGVGMPDSFSRRRLGGYEVASALALTLTNDGPDPQLLEAAAADALSTSAQLRPHVLRLLKTQATTVASDAGTVLVQFFRQYFLYNRVQTTPKDMKVYPFHHPTALMNDTDLLLTSLFLDGKDFMTKVLTTPESHITPGTKGSYNLTSDAATGPRVAVGDQRTGILTQPSFLVGFSGNEETDVVRRGKFIRENLLCAAIPPLAIAEVPPLPELGKDATMRDRLQAHSSTPACAVCHKLMDPLGLGLEAYDHMGRYRMMEGIKPVDASGVLTGTGSQDGPFSGVRTLAQKLAANPAANECLIRNAFRFLFGRNETPQDACTLAAASEAYRRTGGDPTELLTALLASDSLLYRRVSN